MPTPKHKQAHDAVNTPPSRDPELMRRMYSFLTKCRAASPVTRGLEATLVGSLIGLLPEDSLTIMNASAIPSILFGKNRPELLDLAPLDAKTPPLETSAHIGIAAGYALERSLRQKPGLVLAFAGETDTLTSARDIFSFAAMHKLPLVITVQHNLAKGNHLHDLGHAILGVGFPGITVDGSDAMAVYRVTQEAMYRARHEGGPTLIECKTYRKATIPPRLRAWVQGDPIEYMEEQLRARNFWRDDLRHS